MRPASRVATWLFAGLGAACASPAPAAGDSPTALSLLAVAHGRVRVLVFTSHECPIANAYAPTLRALAEQFRQEPVEWCIVHVDPDLSAAAAAAHATAYQLPGRIVCEPSQATARALGVARTPEAAVVTARGPRYVGRIDDQWRALGTRQANATAHDLAVAIADALAGSAAPVRRVPAVGCLLPEPARP